jgi:hypothetical protein
MIIDYLYYDKRALGRCGLVCKSWLPTSRFHLFSTIRLKPCNIDIALAILCPSHSTVLSYVRRVEIYGGEDMGPETCRSLQQLPPLSAVETLWLYYFRWDSQTFSPMDKLFPFFRNITTLQLDLVEFETLRMAFEFISSATSLECLRLGSIHGGGWKGIDAASLTQFPMPPLKQIIFDRRFYMPALFDWLYLGRPVASVNSVTLNVKFVQTIQSVSGYLQVLGPVLEHLMIIGLGYDDYGYGIGKHVDVISALPLKYLILMVTATQAICDEIDLMHNPFLRTISFEQLSIYRSNEVTTLLSRITSSVIESVTLDIYPPHAAINLRELAALFTGANSVFLERSTKLRFRIHDDVDAMGQTAIRQSLCELDTQRWLEFI